MKRIIVAVNFSKEAENALHYAAALASEYKYEMVLFYLQNISIHTQNAQLSADDFETEIRRNKDKLDTKSIETSLEYKIEVIPHFAMGDFYDELALCISACKTDFVVLGLAQKTLEQEILGNTTSKILHKLRFPTLSVPLNVKYNGISTILVADENGKETNLSAIETLFKLIKEYNSRVELFHVNEKLKDISSIIDDDFENIHMNYKDIDSSEIIQSIRKEILIVKADLLVMIPQSYGFWSSLIHRSKTNVMLSEIDIPLLAIPS